MKKTALITGSSRGIGSATAKLFAENGYNVVINYVNAKEQAFALAKKIKEQGAECICVKADVSVMKEAKALIDTAINAFGGIDDLVNNAGMAQQKLFTQITAQEWDKMLSVNLTGTFNCSQLALKHMLQKHSGKIINISSIWGIIGASCEVHYSAVKAAVIGLTKALAKEVGPSGIQVNCVAPGVIETDMLSGLDAETMRLIKDETPLGVIGKPIDIAETILFLASDKANFITGQVISPNGGMVI